MENVVNSPFFGLVITLICYEVSVYLKKYIKSPLFNPMLITTILIIIILNITNISYDDYNQSASFLTALLLPATSVLGLHIYHQKALLKKYWLPIIAGCFSGAITSIVAVISLAKLLNLPTNITVSLIPKSITTAIAIDISKSLDGIISITIISVIITGMIGSVFAPYFIRLFKLDSPIAQGVAIGSASHALGTAKAVELGEIQLAIAAISIIITGIATVLISFLLV